MILHEGRYYTLQEAEALLTEIQSAIRLMEAQFSSKERKENMPPKDYREWKYKAKVAHSFKCAERRTLKMAIQQHKQEKAAVENRMRFEQHFNASADDPDALLVASWVTLKRVVEHLTADELSLLNVIRERLSKTEPA